MYWATVTPRAVWFIQNIISLLNVIFHQQVKYEHLYNSVFTFRTIPHLSCIKILGQFLFSTLVFLPFFFPNTSVEVKLISFLFLLAVNLRRCKNLQETNLYLCYCCLLTTVLPAVSLRRKTCVLWQSDSVFLMAYCLLTKKLNSVFSVALLSVFFYTQQVLFY